MLRELRLYTERKLSDQGEARLDNLMLKHILEQENYLEINQTQHLQNQFQTVKNEYFRENKGYF